MGGSFDCAQPDLIILWWLLQGSPSVSLMNFIKLTNLSCIQAEMKFPKRYPYEPPEFKFSRPLWHPNIYKDGKLCISILHQPGEDEMSGELASVSWLSAHQRYLHLHRVD